MVKGHDKAVPTEAVQARIRSGRQARDHVPLESLADIESGIDKAADAAASDLD